MEDDELSVSEAARLSRLTPQAVRDAARRGALAIARRYGARQELRFRRSEVETWIRAREGRESEDA